MWAGERICGGAGLVSSAAINRSVREAPFQERRLRQKGVGIREAHNRDEMFGSTLFFSENAKEGKGEKREEKSP